MLAQNSHSTRVPICKAVNTSYKAAYTTNIVVRFLTPPITTPDPQTMKMPHAFLMQPSHIPSEDFPESAGPMNEYLKLARFES